MLPIRSDLTVQKKIQRKNSQRGEVVFLLQKNILTNSLLTARGRNMSGTFGTLCMNDDTFKLCTDGKLWYFVDSVMRNIIFKDFTIMI